MGGRKCHLLHISKVVTRIAIQYQFSNRNERIFRMRPDLYKQISELDYANSTLHNRQTVLYAQLLHCVSVRTLINARCACAREVL